MAGDEDRIKYLMGEVTEDVLDEADAAELDDLRVLLADPSMWDEPSGELGENIVAAIADAASTNGVAAPVTEPSADTSLQVDELAGRRRKRSLSWVGPALLGAAAASLIAVAITRSNNSEDEQAIDGTIQLSGTELQPGVQGQADVREVQSGVWIQFDVPGLPRRDGTDFYQAWLKNVDGTLLVPIGTFHEGDHVVLWAGVNIDDFPILTVTREQAAGPQDPGQGSSGEIVVKGQYVAS